MGFQLRDNDAIRSVKEIVDGLADFEDYDAEDPDESDGLVENERGFNAMEARAARKKLIFTTAALTATAIAAAKAAALGGAGYAGQQAASAAHMAVTSGRRRRWFR